MNNKSTNQKSEPRIRQTIRSDFRQTKIKEEFKSEYKEIKQYFLTEERKEKLGSMNAIKKFFVLPWWLLKAMYLRLTPFRRILFFIGLILLVTSGNIQTNGNDTTLSLNISAVLIGLIFLLEVIIPGSILITSIIACVALFFFNISDTVQLLKLADLRDKHDKLVKEEAKKDEVQ